MLGVKIEDANIETFGIVALEANNENTLVANVVKEFSKEALHESDIQKKDGGRGEESTIFTYREIEYSWKR